MPDEIEWLTVAWASNMTAHIFPDDGFVHEVGPVMGPNCICEPALTPVFRDDGNLVATYLHNVAIGLEDGI